MSLITQQILIKQHDKLIAETAVRFIELARKYGLTLSEIIQACKHSKPATTVEDDVSYIRFNYPTDFDYLDISGLREALKQTGFIEMYREDRSVVLANTAIHDDMRRRFTNRIYNLALAEKYETVRGQVNFNGNIAPAGETHPEYEKVGPAVDINLAGAFSERTTAVIGPRNVKIKHPVYGDNFECKHLRIEFANSPLNKAAIKYFDSARRDRFATNVEGAINAIAAPDENLQITLITTGAPKGNPGIDILYHSRFADSDDLAEFFESYKAAAQTKALSWNR